MGPCWTATRLGERRRRFFPLQAEQYDFAVPEARLGRPAVQRFIQVLNAPATRAALRARGFQA